MEKFVLALLALCAVFAHGQARNCFSRTSAANNGTSCGTMGQCFSVVKSDGAIDGSCSGSFCNPSTNAACSACNTEYCNSLTPSTITCYHRSAGSNSSGLQLQCGTPYSTCYYMTDDSASCGSCSGAGPIPGCTACSTSLCNTVAAKCWVRSATAPSESNGILETCSNRTSACYIKPTTGEAGCGTCDATYTTQYGCISCTTAYCNTMVPAGINCYVRNASSVVNGVSSACPTGATGCYSYANGEAGCGACTTSSISSYGCSTCASSLCNLYPTPTTTMAPSGLSCYSSSAVSMRSADGQKVNCTGATTSCYEYSYMSAGTPTHFAGCGSCTSTNGTFANCRNCSASSCNCNYCSSQALQPGLSLVAAAVGILGVMKLF